MALPIHASPVRVHPHDDPHRRHWGPVTVRIVWDLVALGIRPRPPVIREVREHALLWLGQHADTMEAEDVASAAVVDWLRRRDGRYDAFPQIDGLDILPDPSWRQAVLGGCEPLHEAVFGLAYADGLPFDEVVRRVGVDSAWVRAAQEALREVAKVVVGEDGVATEDWTAAQMDALLARIANTAGNACPGPEGLLTELGRAHAEGCPRCSRAQRLIRAGHLSPGALFAPEEGPALMATEMGLLCLQVHPDALVYARLVVNQLDEHVRVVGDLLLVHADAVPDLDERLAALTERGTPRADQIRGVRRRVRAQWGRKAILGPGLDEVREAVRHAEWGSVEGLSSLPEPLPPPPSSMRWYGSLLLAMLVLAMVGAYAWTHRAPPAVFPVSGTRTGSSVTFDAPDDAYVDVIAIDGHVATSLFHSAALADKGGLATGDGRYALSTDADEVVVVTAPEALPSLVDVGEYAGNPDKIADTIRREAAGTGVVVLARPHAIRIGKWTLDPGAVPWP